MSSRRRKLLAVGGVVICVLLLATGVLVRTHRGPAPTGLQVESTTSSSLDLSWDAVPGAAAYRVRFWTTADRSDLSRATFRQAHGRLETLKPWTTYFLTVSVGGPTGGRDRSKTSTVVRAATLPGSALLRVGSFNISDPHVDDDHKDGHDWSERRKAIAADIHEEKLDVVGVQEAYEDADRESLLDAVNVDGGHYAMQLPADEWRGRDNRILYDTQRLDLLESGYEEYPEQAPDDYERDLVWGVLRHKENGHAFLFVTTHLTPENSRKVRRQGLHLIDRIRKINEGRNPQLPVVVVGDFNTSKFQKRGSSIIDKMDDAGFGDVLGQQYGTYELRKPRAEQRIDAWVGSFNDYDRKMKGHVVSKDRVGHNIDWIFASNSLRIPRWRTVAHFDDGRIRGTIASDHYLVTAHIVLP
jgi:endonuclease/exonuclease/phosphatase family metal-dependent hydrolase